MSHREGGWEVIVWVGARRRVFFFSSSSYTFRCVRLLPPVIFSVRSKKLTAHETQRSTRLETFHRDLSEPCRVVSWRDVRTSLWSLNERERSLRLSFFYFFLFRFDDDDDDAIQHSAHQLFIPGLSSTRLSFFFSEFFSLRRRRRGVVLRVVLVVAGAAQLIHGIINQERKSREQEREKEREKKSIRTISCWPKWENNKRFLSRYTRIDMRAVHVTYIRTVHTCRYIQVRQGKAGKRSLRALCGCCLLSLSLFPF